MDEINNEHMLMGGCAAYLQLMKSPAPEIMAFSAFWAAEKKIDADDLGEEARELLAKLRVVGESERHGLCTNFIHVIRGTGKK